ncbi:uncharacterized protein [Hyperolius riggenbachi]|uniref:uncharacterized protein n=1 Tax=Hyperolius riggenbachi TaxID=752182 RepID=UPI0035A3CB72
MGASHNSTKGLVRVSLWPFTETLGGHPVKFHQYVRMSVGSFDELLILVSPLICRQLTNMRMPVSPAERLLVTLRFLATGESFASLHYQFRLGRSTIQSVVHDTCRQIWEVLQPLYMPEPTEEVWKEAAQVFQAKANFPNCVGAVDGKHIRIQLPAGSGSRYINYKKYFSLVLMAVVDAQYRFLAVDLGSYGSTAGSNIFRLSNMGKKLYAGQLNLPGPCPIIEGGDPFPHVLVGDEAFALHTNLMKPFPRTDLDISKRIFNYRLSRARRYVECAFGILSNKWRVFHTTLVMTPDNVENVVKAACVLHNFVRMKEGVNSDEIPDHAFTDTHSTAVSRNNEAGDVRTRFANYFVSREGAIPFQYEQI